MNNRENFEAWASDNGKWPLAILRRNGAYVLMQTQQDWLAWQSATNQQAEQLTIAKQRIADLEKDCEILQTNYDAARQASRFTADVADQAMADLKAAEKQIEQLREALSLLLDCAIHGYDMPEDHSYAIISRNALEQTK